MKKVYEAIGAEGKANGEFLVQELDEAKATVDKWTGGVGCTGVLEVSLLRSLIQYYFIFQPHFPLQIVGNNSALTSAYELVRPFGIITSVGVQPPTNVPFIGQQMYDKNISLDYGRCPARAMFPAAFELLGM